MDYSRLAMKTRHFLEPIFQGLYIAFLIIIVFSQNSVRQSMELPSLIVSLVITAMMINLMRQILELRTL